MDLFSALIWGDPHFITLDKKSFTFNGLGEYTMVAIDDGTFELQARTKRTSGRGLGTVFSAAAAKDTNTPAVEGRINSNGNSVVVYLFDSLCYSLMDMEVQMSAVSRIEKFSLHFSSSSLPSLSLYG